MESNLNELAAPAVGENGHAIHFAFANGRSEFLARPMLPKTKYAGNDDIRVVAVTGSMS